MRSPGLLAAASKAASVTPLWAGWRLAAAAGSADALLRRGRYRDAADNQAAVGGTSAPAAVGSYGRYWFESFALPGLDPLTLDRGFSFRGYDRIIGAQLAGSGPLLVLPHLGGWEWAAAWLARIDGAGVTAVAERLADPEVFDWFVELRSSYGVEVLAHDDPSVPTTILQRLEERRIVCLLADRAVDGQGVEVEFFGRRAVVPGGPALLALRSGAPLLPTVVYFRPHDRWTDIGAPVAADRQGRLRDDVHRVTQAIVGRLEELITAAPSQWHVRAPFGLDTEGVDDAGGVGRGSGCVSD